MIETCLLLSCDDYVYIFEGYFYAANQEKYDFYQRYLRVFDSLKLVVRCEKEQRLKESRKKLDDPRIRVVPVPMFHGAKQYLQRYFHIKDILRNVANGCDAAVLRLPSTVSMCTLTSVQREKLPYAVEVVFDAYDGFVSATNWIHKLLWKRIDMNMRRACYNANGVSCVTEYYLQNRYYTRLVDGFSSNYSSLALDKSFYLSYRKYPEKEKFTIAHVANQVEYNGRKGHNTIIRMVALLKERGINVHVKFVGIDYLNGISKLSSLAESLGVKKQISFVGYLSKVDLRNYLIDADLFVLPTKAEGLPRVLIEAMAVGLPCISTNVSGNPELLDCHFLIDYSDYEAMAQRVEELVKFREKYELASAINFQNSLKYEASLLQKRRDTFYRKLKDVCECNRDFI